MRGLCFLSEHIHNAHVYISWSYLIFQATAMLETGTKKFKENFRP